LSISLPILALSKNNKMNIYAISRTE
jgi:hypothetical protein